MELQILAGSLLQHGPPMVSQPLWCGSLPEVQVDLCIPVVLHGLQGHSCLTMGWLHHGVQSNLSSGAWSTSSPSFSTDLDVFKVVPFAYSHSALLWLQLHLHNSFFFYS